MTGLALVLVLSSAVCHAVWNLIAKRIGGGAPFAWLITALSATIYAPVGVAFWIIERPVLDAEAWLFIAGTALLHSGYFILLLRGYRTGDLSVVYPVARGFGPLLAAVGAIVLLGERPTPLALAGVVLVVGGILAMSAAPSGSSRSSAIGVGWGISTGVVIATYTLWDKHAVDALAIPVVVYSWAEHAGRVAVLSPFAVRDRQTLREVWRAHRRGALAVATLSPLAYVLVLTALATSPVSYVAPIRESSILIGVLLGAKLLGERGTVYRAPAAAAIVLGVIALAIG
jgi:drug/metabolite transporter (DMT)-like permease